MCYSDEVLPTDSRLQVNFQAVPLVGSLYRLVLAMLRVAQRRSISKKAAACRPPPSLSPLRTQDPSSPNDDFQSQHHLNLTRKAHPSLSFICNWLEGDDVHIVVGCFPIRAGGFTDIWRGFLDNRQVAIKSYRRYLSIDPSQIFLVGVFGPTWVPHR